MHLHLDMREPPKTSPGAQELLQLLPAEEAGIPLLARQSRERAPVAVACPCRVICAWSYLGWVLTEECVPMGQVFP